MKKKIVQSTKNLHEYLFGHPLRKIFTFLFLILLIPVSYCGFCVVSALDTSEDGIRGALTTIFFAPDYGPMAVAAGNGGYIYYTMDGSTWLALQIAPATVNFRSAVFTGKNYVVAGGDGAATCAIYYSSNGTSWTQASVSGACQDTVNDLAANGGEVIGVGGLNTFTSNPLELTSSDHGETWTRASIIGPSTPILKIEFDGTYYLAAANPWTINMYRKVPGGTFAAAPANPLEVFVKGDTLGDLYRIPGTARIVAAGSRDNITPPASSDFSDTSSASWTPNASDVFVGNTTQFPRALAFGKGRLIAVGDGCRVDYSDDAKTSLTWNFDGIMTGCAALTTWRSAARVGGNFVAAGDTGGALPTGIIAISPTGNPNDWIFQPSGTPPLYAIAAQ